MKRRTLLRTAGLGGLATLSGCLDAVPGRGETTLGWFGVYNLDRESGHTFAVRIERNGTVVHESEHEIAAYDSSSDESSPPHAVVDCTWENADGNYSVFVSRDEGDWHQYEIVDTELRPPECVIVYARYGELHHHGPDEPTFHFVLDETTCEEVRTLPGGCPDAVPTDTA